MKFVNNKKVKDHAYDPQNKPLTMDDVQKELETLPLMDKEYITEMHLNHEAYDDDWLEMEAADEDESCPEDDEDDCENDGKVGH